MGQVATPGYYAAHLPIVVVPALSDLRGPTEGIVSLPIHLHWGPKRTYDLAVRDDARWLYSRTLREAGSIADLTSIISEAVLLTVWTDLALPDRVREAWEQRFPALGQRP